MHVLGLLVAFRFMTALAPCDNDILHRYCDLRRVLACHATLNHAATLLQATVKSIGSGGFGAGSILKHSPQASWGRTEQLNRWQF